MRPLHGASVTSGFERWFAAYAASPGFAQILARAHFDNEDDEPSRQSRTLPYQPFAKQQEFHSCNAKYRLFGGAAGPGKSKALLMEAIVQANEVPRANTLLLRRTFPELESSLLLYFRRDVPRELYRSFNEAKRTVTWLNGSTTRFGYSQSENDIYQYQSGEYLFIGVDELTHFSLRQWQFLTSRNRCPVPDSFPNMAGATNPGNIGHAWVKALFVDKQPAAGMDAREYDPADYGFISARVWDNPIYANDPSYLKTLQLLPDFFRRAFLDGDWSVFAGQYFTNFDPSRSVIRAETIAAEAWWPRWISIDWGFEHPAAVYWHTRGTGFQSVVNQGADCGRPGACSAGMPPAGTGAARQQSGPTVMSKGPSPDRARETRVSVENERFAEGQRHRLEDSHTHAHGCDLPAKNAENPRAGVAAPSSVQSRLASRASDAAAAARFKGPADCGTDAPSGFVGSGFSSDRARETRVPGQALSGPEGRPCEDAPLARGAATTITYREFVGQHLAPRTLSAEIIERSRTRDGGAEKIDAIYLSPDAFAHRTDESSIAEQMGDVLAAAGLPRPAPADNDRVGGWMLMYQMLDANEWRIADSCPELIRTLPELVRDAVNVEDIAKRDGDDPADAARYGLKSRVSARIAKPPREQELQQRVTSSDPTIRAIQARKAELELPQRNQPVFGRFSRWRRR